MHKTGRGMAGFFMHNERRSRLKRSSGWSLSVVSIAVLMFGALGLSSINSVQAQEAKEKPAAKPISEEEKARREKMGGYRPDRMKNPNLTSIPPRMTETPVEDIPLKDIKVPPGFEVDVWAHGMPGARMMTRWTVS